MTLITPPMASAPYNDDAGPLSTSIRSMLPARMVERLVAPAGRPSMSRRLCLVIPENSGLNPRILIPERAPGYWMTSMEVFFFRTSVRSAATVA